MSKKYGLIKKNTIGGGGPKGRSKGPNSLIESAFESDSDSSSSDGLSEKASISRTIQAEAKKKAQKAQALIDQSLDTNNNLIDAMDYDKHHDDIVKKREEENIIKQTKELQQRGKSRYIESLLKAGEKRDMEYERTRER